MVFFGFNLEKLQMNIMFFMFEPQKITLMHINCRDANAIHMHQTWLFTIFQFDLNDLSMYSIGHSICHSNIFIDHHRPIEIQSNCRIKATTETARITVTFTAIFKNYDSQALSFLAKVLSPE